MEHSDLNRIFAKIEKTRVNLKREMPNYNHRTVDKVVIAIKKELETLLPVKTSSDEQLTLI
jgi:hypothetical protein